MPENVKKRKPRNGRHVAVRSLSQTLLITLKELFPSKVISPASLSQMATRQLSALKFLVSSPPMVPHLAVTWYSEDSGDAHVDAVVIGWLRMSLFHATSTVMYIDPFMISEIACAQFRKIPPNMLLYKALLVEAQWHFSMSYSSFNNSMAGNNDSDLLDTNTPGQPPPAGRAIGLREVVPFNQTPAYTTTDRDCECRRLVVRTPSSDQSSPGERPISSYSPSPSSEGSQGVPDLLFESTEESYGEEFNNLPTDGALTNPIVPSDKLFNPPPVASDRKPIKTAYDRAILQGDVIVKADISGHGINAPFQGTSKNVPQRETYYSDVKPKICPVDRNNNDEPVSEEIKQEPTGPGYACTQ